MLTTSGRIGCFFLLIGAVLLFLFLASDLARAPEVSLLVAGVLLFLFGWMLFRKGRQESRPSGRFRILRRHPEDEDQ